MTKFIAVITTVPKKETAEKIAAQLLNKKLAGCVQIIGPIKSSYWWKGRIEQAQEWFCVIKSREDLFEDLKSAIEKIHPYQVPEILAVPVLKGNHSYLEWLESELKSDEI